MDKKMNVYYELCEAVEQEAETINKKIRNSGGQQMSANEMEYLKNLTDATKNLKSIIGMIEAKEEGYSGNFWDGKYYDNGNMSMENREDRGRSRETQGGRSNARRMSRDGRSMDNYSREEAREDFMDEVEELVDKAPSERIRRKFERFLNELR
jgi:hypothetical protein